MWADHYDHVRPEWLDANGHMNMAFYVVVFDRGTDAWLDLAGIGTDYRRAAGHSVFAVETHTLYQREVGLGERLRVRSRLIAAAGKRLHLIHEMTAAEDVAQDPVALQEVLFLHVDLATRRSAVMPPEVRIRVAGLLPANDDPVPPWVGRRVGQARQS